ncbi:MAG: hypothetical protein OEY59_03225 [Deltaproteobacteria bacterium]|nr:hypothetical protein [Deltaproteobacteria bacterium]
MESSNENKSAWEAFPPEYLVKLKEIIGEDDFEKLNNILTLYNLFAEKAFQEPAELIDENPCNYALNRDLSMGLFNLSNFLGSVGNQLGQSDQDDYIDDALDILRISLRINPENLASRMTLALLCYCFSDLQEEAVKQANLTLETLDKMPSAVPEDAIEDMRSKMNIIIEGKDFDYPDEEEE